jgi:gamma-glutamylcyclotransferase (GGCT)/AIG2-like uncharacterized protein YtfP
MRQKTLRQIAEEKPFEDYAEWWKVGTDFSKFMSQAIVSEWSKLHNNDGNLEKVVERVSEYLRIVFVITPRENLVGSFVNQPTHLEIESGELDALSYAFYRSAYELIARHIEAYEHSLEIERRSFTKRVGKIFFGFVRDHLKLDLPTTLEDEQSFVKLKECIKQIGNFLLTQGYLRDHFNFLFSLDTKHAGKRILQKENRFVTKLREEGSAYALYEMGYPIILPSAVYLYHTIREAQHHSSRTIEELFDLIGYEARETDDFDPTGYPSDMVVELWEIKKLD